MALIDPIVFKLTRQSRRWGIAAVVFAVGQQAFDEWNLYLYDHGRPQVVSFLRAAEICVVVQLAAVICGIVAMRHGTKWWVIIVLLALIKGLGCFFGEV